MGLARLAPVLVVAACGGRATTVPSAAVDTGDSGARGEAPAAIGDRATAGGDHATTDADGRAASRTPAAPRTLAAAPRIDLDANRPRWHVYDRGLVVPIGGEGLRKYDLAYRSPWSDATVAGGVAGRRAKGKATLTIPWLAEDGDGPAELIVRGRGLDKLAVRLDGVRLDRPTVDGGVARFAIAAGRLAAGEHTLALEAARAAHWSSLELAPAGAAACAAPDTWRRVSLYAELPAGAHLIARPTGAAAVRVRVTDESGTTAVAYEGAATGLAAPIALPAQIDHVVRIDLEAVDGCARWDGATIGVLASPSPSPSPNPSPNPNPSPSPTPTPSPNPSPNASPTPSPSPNPNPIASPSPNPTPPVDNVVLIVVDTLRADRLAAYGPTRVETPRMTAAAARGAVFLRHQSMAPSSPPSHATIHTGQIPRVHGVTGDDGDLGADTPILSAILAGAGLTTAYIGNNDFAMSRFKQPGRWDSFETPYYASGKDCAPIIERALDRVRAAQAAHRRFFVSLLPIEPHVGYRFHEGVTERYHPGPWGPVFRRKVTGAQLGRLASLRLGPADWDQLRALYDGEVTHFDACYGALEDGLAAAGLLERTAIVIASDHGEGMGERGGRAGHAYGLQRELVATPLIVAGGVPTARIAVPTSNLDLAPTVLALLGLPPDPRMQGRDLVPLTRAAVVAPAVVASEYGKSYGLRAGRWHLVVGYSGDQQLYDVAVDPDEDHDRAAASPIALRYLRDAAGLFLAHRTRWHTPTWGTLADLAPGNPLAAAALPSRP